MLSECLFGYVLTTNSSATKRWMETFCCCGWLAHPEKINTRNNSCYHHPCYKVYSKAIGHPVAKRQLELHMAYVHKISYLSKCSFWDHYVIPYTSYAMCLPLWVPEQVALASSPSGNSSSWSLCQTAKWTGIEVQPSFIIYYLVVQGSADPLL